MLAPSGANIATGSRRSQRAKAHLAGKTRPARRRASGAAAGLYSLPSRDPPVADRHSDEADIPTEKAQARPCARVSCPHADAGRAADAEAATLKGPQAPHGLSVVDRRYAGTGRRAAGRLSRSAEFDRVYRQGRSVANRYLVLYTFPRADGDASARSGCRSAGGSAARSSATASSGCCARRSARTRRPAGRDSMLSWSPDRRRASLPRPRACGASGEAVGELLRQVRPPTRGARRDEAAPRVVLGHDRRIPADDIAAHAAPLQVRADLLAVRRAGGTGVRHTPRPASVRVAPAPL